MGTQYNCENVEARGVTDCPWPNDVASLESSPVVAINFVNDCTMAAEFVDKSLSFHATATILIVSATTCQEGDWQTLPNFTG